MWHPREKRLDFQRLVSVRNEYRARGQTVVWSNGTFDLLHPGHASSLQQARSLGDVLIVGVNSDRSVRAYKGPSRPVLGEDDRANMIAALECVDYVTIFDDDTPIEVLRILQPDVHCKGAEYAPPNGRPVPERAVVESYGGRIEYLPLVPGISTSTILQMIHDKELSV